jgi:hypothetical protein
VLLGICANLDLTSLRHVALTGRAMRAVAKRVLWRTIRLDVDVSTSRQGRNGDRQCHSRFRKGRWFKAPKQVESFRFLQATVDSDSQLLPTVQYLHLHLRQAGRVGKDGHHLGDILENLSHLQSLFLSDRPSGLATFLRKQPEPFFFRMTDFTAVDLNYDALAGILRHMPLLHRLKVVSTSPKPRMRSDWPPLPHHRSLCVDLHSKDVAWRGLLPQLQDRIATLEVSGGNRDILAALPGHVETLRLANSTGSQWLEAVIAVPDRLQRVKHLSLTCDSEYLELDRIAGLKSLESLTVESQSHVCPCDSLKELVSAPGSFVNLERLSLSVTPAPWQECKTTTKMPDDIVALQVACAAREGLSFIYNDFRSLDTARVLCLEDEELRTLMQ